MFLIYLSSGEKVDASYTLVQFALQLYMDLVRNTMCRGFWTWQGEDCSIILLAKLILRQIGYVDNLVQALLLASMGLIDDIPGRKGAPASGQAYFISDGNVIMLCLESRSLSSW